MKKKRPILLAPFVSLIIGSTAMVGNVSLSIHRGADHTRSVARPTQSVLQQPRLCDRVKDDTKQPESSQYYEHLVKAGDTVGSILWYYLDRNPNSAEIAEVRKCNQEFKPNFNPSKIRAGEIIRIPYQFIKNKRVAYSSRDVTHSNNPAAPQSLRWATNLKQGTPKGTIVIDAGHGGSDSGAVYGKNIREKDLTLDYSLALAEEFRKNGFKVVETRIGDLYVGLKKRSSIGRKGNVCLSIHLNSYKRDLTKAVGKVPSGAIVLYGNSQWAARELADSIMYHLAPIMGVYNKGTCTPRDIGRKRLEMVNGVPNGVLIELGFLNNPQDLRNLSIRQSEIVRAVYTGVTNYLACK